MSARETHVTEWGLYGLAERQRERPMSSHMVRACDGSPLSMNDLVTAFFSGNVFPSSMLRTHVPTCPRCAVLRDEALEGRLPKRA